MSDLFINDELPGIILNDKSEYFVELADVSKWKELYPKVDIESEIRAMAGWADANPTKRKTKKGIKRFINSWLARSQDKGGSSGMDSSFGKSVQGGRKTRSIGSAEELTEIGWVDPEILEGCKVYFLNKYGCYHINGVKYTQ